MQPKLPWMKYDPDIVSMDIDGMTLAEEGAYSRCVRHLWKIGPLPEERLRRLCGEQFEAVKTCLKEYPEGWSLPWLEGARSGAVKGRKQKSDAGKKSAESQGLGQRPLDGRLSISTSSSNSPSESNSNSEKERAKKESETLFDDAAITPEDAKAANAALHDLSPDWKHYTDAISTYSAVKSIKRTRKGWLATYRQFINGDNQKGMLKSTKPTTTAAWNPRA